MSSPENPWTSTAAPDDQYSALRKRFQNTPQAGHYDNGSDTVLPMVPVNKNSDPNMGMMLIKNLMRMTGSPEENAEFRLSVWCVQYTGIASSSPSRW